MVRYLREKAPTYIYSNPISAPEASASLIALEIVDSARGEKLLAHLSELTAYFRKGLLNLGYEVIQGVHPIVPLVLRDTQKTVALVKHLKENGVRATGLNYPVVPRGDDEIRFQVCADQSFADLDSVLEILGNFRISRN
jgi:glycine C-acetyltransferase